MIYNIFLIQMPWQMHKLLFKNIVLHFQEKNFIYLLQKSLLNFLKQSKNIKLKFVWENNIFQKSIFKWLKIIKISNRIIFLILNIKSFFADPNAIIVILPLDLPDMQSELNEIRLEIWSKRSIKSLLFRKKYIFAQESIYSRSKL